ncbi:mechanosensitive ion channel protein MscL [Aerococcus urinaehominis]|uniref:Large-conductance mechanosensitive channel n=1 Tax=Aerococcus urinaehominis TaxID=128944 RepID=A0A0X8FM74_9LACT|nr:large conductance mechanosensitive channel protein MscL [Aerococcus urinaehominis]AMB99217.1 mechanosensitive ion channel protein MscL [Aerococcus urinaehominis]SDM32063.1 large conductance mechanosensitive channel [Aerococcus urinaehominis]
MLEDFKNFIAKGNVMDMAIGVVMASAFTAIVNSLVDDIIMPFIGLIMGDTDFTNIVLNIAGAEIGIGNFIQAVVTFLIIAIVLFFVIRSVAAFKNKFDKAEEVEEDDKPSAEELLAEIRDELRKNRLNQN